MNNAVTRKLLGEDYIPKKKKQPHFTVRDRDCPDCGNMIIPYITIEEKCQKKYIAVRGYTTKDGKKVRAHLRRKNGKNK